MMLQVIRDPPDRRFSNIGVSIMKRAPAAFRSVVAISWALLLLLMVAGAQLPLAAQDYKFTIPTAQPWTDTGVDLQPGDVLAVTAAPSASGCDPAGVASTNSAAQNLPVPAANPGALITRLQENGPAALVGASQQLRVAESGHLFLGINASGTPPCQGTFAVRVHLRPGGPGAGAEPMGPATSAPAATGSPAAKSSEQTSSKPVPRAQASTSAAETKASGDKEVKDIKGALASAAETWLSGQFGAGVAATSPPAAASSPPSGSPSSSAKADAAPAAPALRISSSTIDAQLRKIIDGLPRRVNDQFQNQGDMVNFVIVGPLQKVQDALTTADWQVADRDVKESVIKAVLQTYEKKAYLGMPMSELYLFGRVQDYGYEQAEPYAVVASRHHFRLWKAPLQWNGQDVWVGAGTHDIGFEKDQRNGKVTHKIDPAVDTERDNIGGTLQKGGKVKSLTYYLPPSPVQDARNATGGGYHSDGRILVITLQ